MLVSAFNSVLLKRLHRPWGVCVRTRKGERPWGQGWLRAPRKWLNTWYPCIHFKITCDPCNLIGCQECDIFTNQTFFFGFKSRQDIHVLDRVISTLNRTNFRSVLQHFSISWTKWEVKTFFVFAFQTSY